MSKRIITISREFGSGGRFIGEEIAKKLGIAYYDVNDPFFYEMYFNTMKEGSISPVGEYLN